MRIALKNEAKVTLRGHAERIRIALARREEADASIVAFVTNPPLINLGDV